MIGEECRSRIGCGGLIWQVECEFEDLILKYQLLHCVGAPSSDASSESRGV